MQLNDNEAWLAHVIDGVLRDEIRTNIAIAVSGGSDSLALLYLAADYSQRSSLRFKAVTVDHGLRSEAAEEARFVSEVCRTLGVEHTF